MSEHRGVDGDRYSIRSLGLLSVDTDWMDEAACRDSELEFVLYNPVGHHTVARLKAVCANCPVKAQCLEYALEQPSSMAYGVYGGTTPAERRALVKTS